MPYAAIPKFSRSAKISEMTPILHAYQCKECTYYFKTEDIICISSWESDEHMGYYCKKCIELLEWRRVDETTV